MTLKLNFKKETLTATLPVKHTELSAGIDFYADETLRIPAAQHAQVSTGISWKPDPRWLGQFGTDCTLTLIMQSRSGLAFKESIEASNAGVIDMDYFPKHGSDGIIHVKLYNYSDKSFWVKPGDRIAQGVLQLVPIAVDVEVLDSERTGGFGSSDAKEPNASPLKKHPGVDYSAHKDKPPYFLPQIRDYLTSKRTDRHELSTDKQ